MSFFHEAALKKSECISEFAQRHLESIYLTAKDLADRSYGRDMSLAVSSSANDSKTLNQFHQFNLLPQELKNKIWKLYMSFNPRVIILPFPKFHHDGLLTSKPTLSAMSIFQVNRALRKLALVEYGYRNIFLKLTLYAQLDEGHSLTLHPDIDMIYLQDSPRRCQTLLNQYQITSCLRQLAIDLNCLLMQNSNVEGQGDVLDFAVSCTALEILFLVARCYQMLGEPERTIDIPFGVHRQNRVFRSLRIRDYILQPAVRALNPCSEIQKFMDKWAQQYGETKSKPRTEVVKWEYLERASPRKN